MTKKLAIMQPYLFPYIGYFQLINAVDKFVVYDDVAFIKQGWINRNNILVNSHSFLFTVPVKNISSYSLILDTEVANGIDWQTKLLKTIKYSYQKAPYYQKVFQIIENVFTSDNQYISRVAINSIKEVIKYLEISTELQDSSTSYKNNTLSAQARVLDICQQELASQYINPIGGIELYSKNAFRNQGIELSFIDSKPIRYKQVKNNFIPNLSIIDILMFNSPEEVKAKLQQYELI
jgi:WbqC-like protein family